MTDDELVFTTTTHKSLLRTRWWQFRRRYREWQQRRAFKRLPVETQVAVEDMRRDIERAFFFGSDA